MLPIRAAIYLRISQDRDADELAVDRQRSDCERILRERGWDLYRIYSDTLSAASKKVERPQYEQMRADFDAGMFDALVCYDLDRLTRQPRQLEDWIDAAEGRGLVLVTANGEADLSNDNGRMFARIKASVARGEIEAKVRRQTSKNRQLAEKGQPIIGIRPFGFEVNRIDLREDEAALIREAYATVLRGGTLWSVIRLWNDAGVKTTRGKAWTAQALRRVLTRPRNAGLLEYRGAIVKEGLPAIVSAETFEAVGAIVTDPSRDSAPGPKVLKHFATGLAACGVCGSPMASAQARNANGVLLIYKCKKKAQGGGIGERHPTIQRAELERAIASEAFAALMEEPPEASGSVGIIEPLRTQRAEVERRRAAAQDMLLEPDVDKARVRKQLAEFAAQIEGLNAQIARLATSSALEEVRQRAREWVSFATNGRGWDEARDSLADLGGAFNALSVEDKRTLVRATLSVIVNPVGKGERIQIERLPLTTTEEQSKGTR